MIQTCIVHTYFVTTECLHFSTMDSFQHSNGCSSLSVKTMSNMVSMTSCSVFSKNFSRFRGSRQVLQVLKFINTNSWRNKKWKEKRTLMSRDYTCTSVCCCFLICIQSFINTCISFTKEGQQKHWYELVLELVLVFGRNSYMPYMTNFQNHTISSHNAAFSWTSDFHDFNDLQTSWRCFWRLTTILKIFKVNMNVI